MRQLPSDKYNVAWFKLAEFVARGERERALCLYKLLIHSFNDYALAAQLEGDILLAFNDISGACERYREAAEIYKQDKRFIESAAILEHCLLFEKSPHDYLSLITLYTELAMDSRLRAHCEQLCMVLSDSNSKQYFKTFLDEWEHTLSDDVKVNLYRCITLQCIKNKNEPDLIRSLLKKTVHYLVSTARKSSLQAFLSTLETLDEQYYYDAAEQIQEL